MMAYHLKRTVELAVRFVPRGSVTWVRFEQPDHREAVVVSDPKRARGMAYWGRRGTAPCGRRWRGRGGWATAGRPGWLTDEGRGPRAGSGRSCAR